MDFLPAILPRVIMCFVMDSQIRRRQRIRRILLIVILATIPFYCLGFVVLWGATRLKKQNSVTSTSTQAATITSMITQTPPTLIYFPTQTNTMTPTITLTHTVTSTPTKKPTRTATPTDTATFIPTFTPTFTPPSTETPTETPPETPTETLVIPTP